APPRLRETVEQTLDDPERIVRLTGQRIVDKWQARLRPQRGDRAADLVQCDRARVRIDAAPIACTDEADQRTGGTQVFELRHQSAHDVTVHSVERLFELFAVPCQPPAHQTSVVSNFLLLLGAAPAVHDYSPQRTSSSR